MKNSINNKSKAIIVGLVLIIGFFVFLPHLHENFLKNQNAQKSEFQQKLKIYYLDGGYEQDLRRIVEEAKNYFSKIEPKNNSVIIFDIDDTSLYHYQVRGDTKFIWENQPFLVQAREVDIAPPILPVLDLYKFLVKKGFKIIFLSSRNSGQYQKTIKEFTNAGYTNFEKVILMPDKLAFDRSIKTADWKLDERKKISESFDIIASVGDRDVDFVGGYTGHKIKLPNLYLDFVNRSI